MSAIMSAVAAGGDIDTLRKAWKDANMAPLWENKFAHRPPPPPEATYLWSWEKIRPLIDGAITVASPQAIERRGPPGAAPPALCAGRPQDPAVNSANLHY